MLSLTNCSRNPAIDASLPSLPHCLSYKAAVSHQHNIVTHNIMATGLKRNNTTGVGRIRAMTMLCAHVLRHCSNREIRVSSLRAISSRVRLSWVLYQPGESRTWRQVFERPEDGLRGRRAYSVATIAFCRSDKSKLAAVRPLRIREVVFMAGYAPARKLSVE